MAGLKLNEDSALVRSFTRIFTRVVIFPDSSLRKITDPKELEIALDRKQRINSAAFRELYRLRKSGRLIIVYPTGTRFRPWDPSTGRGVKEVDSYIRYFKYMVLVSINGNTLRLSPNDEMQEDIPARDVMMYTFSPIYLCKKYRKDSLESLGPKEDPHQHVIDSVMDELRTMHDRTEQERQIVLRGTDTDNFRG